MCYSYHVYFILEHSVACIQGPHISFTVTVTYYFNNIMTLTKDCKSRKLLRHNHNLAVLQHNNHTIVIWI